MALTKRQADVLEFITRFQEQKGFSPTYREIAKEFSMRSPGTIAGIIRRLKEKGYLENRENSSSSQDRPKGSQWRSLKRLVVFKGGAEIIEVPLIAEISHHEPLELLKQIELIPVLNHFHGHPRTYALYIKDSSFDDFHLLPGDIVIIDKRADRAMQSIRPGEFFPGDLFIGQDVQGLPHFIHGTEKDSKSSLSILGKVLEVIRTFSH